MQIFFHVGPHKTGTTSIQDALLKQFGSEKPSKRVWYPTPSHVGPGHAALAHNAAMGETAISDTVARASRAGVGTLILSSESFATSPKSIRACAEAFAGHPVVLITTQNSLMNRIASRWQEDVKHGETGGIEVSGWRFLAENTTSRDFLQDIAHVIKPERIAIIYSGASTPPSFIVDAFARCLGETIRKLPTTRLNTRRGLIETELQRHLNRLINEHMPNDTPVDQYKLRSALSENYFSRMWSEACPDVAIETPPDLVEAALARTHEFVNAIDRLSRSWDVTEYGERAVMFETPATPH